MARPRKSADRLHSERLHLWLTEEQIRAVEALADARDMPKSVLAREALLLGLRAYLRSVAQDRAA